MITFLIDIGNTTIKWGIFDQKEVIFLGRMPYQRHLPYELILQQWVVVSKPKNVLISNVAEPSAGEQASELIKTCWNLEPIFIHENQQLAGIKSLKTQSILGVDRWLALLALCQTEQQAFALVGCGTAITLDVCNRGEHLGGLIAPGIELMRLSLEEHTAGCRLNATNSDTDALFATDTDGATRLGTLRMGAAFIQSTLETIEQRLDLSVKKFITGGDAIRLMPFFDKPKVFVQEPGLVLKGLALFQGPINK